MLGSKVMFLTAGLYPVIREFRRSCEVCWFHTLMMSTALTFGAISALFGLLHDIVTRDQHLFLVAVVIPGEMVPTLTAGAAFMPRHLHHEKRRHVDVKEAG